LSREPNVGLIFRAVVLPDSARSDFRGVARYRLPAIYVQDVHMTEGGLMQYTNDPSEPLRQAPFYVDRSSRAPSRVICRCNCRRNFKFIVNRKTASALGIELPLGLLLPRTR